MKLSVIVAAYNAERHIGRLLCSVVRQKFYDKHEIIVVDDGSTDQTLDIVKRTTKKFTSVKIISQPNAGLVAARQTGFNISVGEYVTFIDADDYIDDEFYNSIFSEVENYDVDVIACGHKTVVNGQIFHVNNNAIKAGYYENFDTCVKLDKLPSSLIDKLFPGIFTYTWNKIFKRNLVEEVIYQIDRKVTIGEDACLSYGCILNADSLYIAKSTHYNYVQHSSSMMNSIKSEATELEQIRTLLFNLLRISKMSKRRLSRSVLAHYLFSLLLIRCPKHFYTKFRLYFDLKFLMEIDNAFIYGVGPFARSLSKLFPDEKVIWINSVGSVQCLSDPNRGIQYGESIADKSYCRIAILNERLTSRAKNMLTDLGFKGEFLDASQAIQELSFDDLTSFLESKS